MESIDKTNESVIPPKGKIFEENIPNDLKLLQFWGLWQWVFKEQWTKVPINKNGNFIDAKQFGLTFEQAFKAFSKNDSISGIGFYFSPDCDIFGVDFDDCIVDGKVDKAVKKKLKELDTYWEISPSGKGIHAISSGAQLLNGVDRKMIYAGSRYFTFTGNGRGKLNNASSAANKLFNKPKLIEQSTTGNQESDIKFKDLKSIIVNIRPDLPEPDWFLVCKAIHYKTLGSEKGLSLFAKWSAGKWSTAEYKYKDYDYEACVKKWNRCKIGNENVGLPTLREGESRYPVEVKKKKKKKLFVQKLEQENYNNVFLTEQHIPKNMRSAAIEVARFNRVSIDPVITTMLMVFSAAINKKVKIIEREGLTHNCSMGAIIGMPSGGRKSAIDRPLIYPFKEYEKQLIKDWEGHLAGIKAEEKIYKGELTRTENSKELGMEEKISFMTSLNKKIASLQINRPKLIESDATEERLSDSLAKNNETMFIQSDDARNTIKNITGRYDNTSENIYICGLTGDTYRRSRIGDDVEILLHSPCINMSLKVQLDLLRELVTRTSMRESGLLARLFIKVLEENVSNQFRENVDEDDLNFKLMDNYNQAITEVLKFDGQVICRLSKKARLARIEFSNFYADKLDNEWGNYKDVSNKIVSLSVKMAVVLVVMNDPGILSRCKNEFGISTFTINEKDYNLAKDIVLILMQQSLNVLNLLEKNSIMEGAKILLEKLEKIKNERGINKWSMSDIKYKYSTNRRLHVESWVNCLVEEGILELNNLTYSLI